MAFPHLHAFRFSDSVFGKAVTAAGVLVLTAAVALAADTKFLPGQAGNDDIELEGTVLLDRPAIRQALGTDLDDGYVVVRMKAIPRGDKPLRIGPDDFTLISRKNGDRSQALSPEQIAGSGALVVRTGKDTLSSPGMRFPGTSTVEVQTSQQEDSALLVALKAKVMADVETKQPAEGLLYFPLGGKLKPKDVSVIYKGPAGRLVMDFR